MSNYPNEHAGFPSLSPPKIEQAPAPKIEQAPAPKEDPKQGEPCKKACANPNCKKVCEDKK